MIPDAGKGLATLQAAAGMPLDRLDRRQTYLKALTGLGARELQSAAKTSDYMKVMDDARAMMDSPIRRAFDYRREEKPEVVEAYQPAIAAKELLDPSYHYGNRLAKGCCWRGVWSKRARATSRWNTNTGRSRASTCTNPGSSG